jgi:NitT/TauT family transport system substrate-binding protein
MKPSLLSSAHKFLYLGIAISLFAACGKDAAPTLSIGTNTWTGYEPLYLARSLGYFDEKKVHLVENSSSSQSLRAYKNNDLNAAALTLDEVLLLKQQGFDPCVILVMDVSDGADVIVAKPEIENMGGLKGKRVGVENTAVGAYTLARALGQAGLSPADVTVVALESDAHEQAYLNNEVDAVVTFEPIRSKLLAANAKQVFDSTQIPGEIVDVLAVQKTYVEAHPERIRYLLDNWFKSLDFLRETPVEAGEHLASRMKLSPEEAIRSFDGLKLPNRAENQALFNANNGDVAPLQQTAQQLGQVMAEQQLLPEPIDASSVCFSAVGL